MGVSVAILAKCILYRISNTINAEVGSRMFSCMAQAVLQKVMVFPTQCNREFTGSNIIKIMQMNVEKLLTYP